VGVRIVSTFVRGSLQEDSPGVPDNCSLCGLPIPAGEIECWIDTAFGMWPVCTHHEVEEEADGELPV
jgi:hypothetical protein